MKRLAIYVVGGAALLMLSSLAVLHFLPEILVWERERCVTDWFGYMCTEKVCRKWGERPLDTERFRAAGRNDETGRAERVRAEMACSLLKNKDEYLGETWIWIIYMFGEPRGYYVSESHPAYLIGGVDREDRDVWQIVFLTKGGIVDDIVVHNNHIQ